MKNILFIGPYRENTGLGRSSRRYVESLLTDTTLNLSIRPIYFTSIIKKDIDQKFLHLENNKSTTYDCVVQHGYPDMFQYNSRFGQHIGIAEIETENLYHTGYIERINLLDKIIVGSSQAASTLSNGGVNIPIVNLPEPYDIDKICLHKKEDFFEEEHSDFIFYTIGNYGEKKNIKSIIIAYLLEFSTYDNVRLLIKTNKHDTTPQSLEKIIGEDIISIQRAIRKNSEYAPKINIITGELSDDDIIRLHSNAHCYVNGARADGNASCSIEAILNNNPVVTTNHIGASDFVGDNNGYNVASIRTSVFSTDFPIDKSMSIYEYWYDPIIDSLREQMRNAFVNHNVMRYNFNKMIFSNKEIGKKIHE